MKKPTKRKELYRELARAIYALALDAVSARDVEYAKEVHAIAHATFKPMADEYQASTPIFGIMECLDIDTRRIHNRLPSDEEWADSLVELKELREVYLEVLG